MSELFIPTIRHLPSRSLIISYNSYHQDEFDPKSTIMPFNIDAILAFDEICYFDE